MIFAGCGAPENSMTTVGVVVNRGRARRQAQICAPFPGAETELMSTQTGLRQIFVPIVTDGMILAWALPQNSAEVIITFQLGCRTRLGRCLSSVRGFARHVRRYTQSMSS